MCTRIADLSERFYEQMVQDRRHFHMYPEISYKEYQTAKYACERLSSVGINYSYPLGENGILARVTGSLPGPRLAFRADMDALKLEEKSHAEYRSKHADAMHACGHDFHTAALLSFAESVHEYRDKLYGEVVFIFQHAEEVGPGGAISMIRDGCLENVDKIYSAHVDSGIDVGKITVKDGIASGSNIIFRAKIQGVGGHSAKPAGTVDSLLTACQCVCAIHTVAGRNINPEEAAAINIGYINSGSARNIICHEAFFGGMVRSYGFDVCKYVMSRIEEIISGVCIANGAKYELQVEHGYPAMINSSHEVEVVFHAVNSFTAFSAVEGDVSFGGEDFSYYLENIPGCMFKVGIRNEEKGMIYAHHHPSFDGDERGLKGIFEAFWAIYLAENGLDGLS